VVFPDGKFDAKLAKEYFPNGLGEMVRPNEYLGPDIKQNHQAYPALQGAEQYNAIQKYFVEQTRLGIPVVMHDEGVHGVWTQEATNQPVPIALASTWDLNLIRQVFAATALEMRSRGAYQSLGPVLDVVREPRWGRTEETWGEDPYLNAQIGIAAVSAMQGKPDARGYLDGSHVGVTLILLLLACHSRSWRLTLFVLPFFLLMCLATVYIRAHYAIDVVAGIVSAVVVYLTLFYIYRRF
jgi:hypothetical protein